MITESPCGNMDCGQCKKANARKSCQAPGCKAWLPVKSVECPLCRHKQIFASPKPASQLPQSFSDKTSSRAIVNRCVRGVRMSKDNITFLIP